MALKKGNLENIPKGALVITRQEAVDYQVARVKAYAKKSELFYYYYGCPILAVASAVPGFFILAFYRKRLNLQEIGKVSSVFISTYVPPIVAALSHNWLISTAVLLQDYSCPICLEMRSSLIQIASSCLYPMIFAPIRSLELASRSYTYDVPSFKNPKEVFRLFLKLSKPNWAIVSLMIASQAVIASFITYKEAEEIDTILGRAFAKENSVYEDREVS